MKRKSKIIVQRPEMINVTKTNTKKRLVISINKILLGVLLCFLCSISLLQIYVFSQVNIDRFQIIYRPDPVNIPLGRDTAFRIYFPYTNPTGSVMKNVVAELRIEGDGFVFVPSEIYDYYNPNDPNSIDCNKPDEKNKNKIITPLSNTSSIVYGLQSANNSSTPSGDTVSDLDINARGCIQVTLALNPNATVGQESIVYMNWYSQDESNSQNQPPIGLYKIRTVPEDYAPVQCQNDEELFDQVCVKVCRLGQIRDLFGVCVDQSTLNSSKPTAGVGTLSVVEFNIFGWLIGVFGSMLFVSLAVLGYAINQYRKYR